jgi:hypothetical protein
MFLVSVLNVEVIHLQGSLCMVSGTVAAVRKTKNLKQDNLWLVLKLVTTIV